MLDHEALDEIVEAILARVQPGILSDESIQSLHRIFQNTLVAALDLIDCGCVLRYKTPWGRTTYEVRGSTDTYRVFAFGDLSLLRPAKPDQRSSTPAFCSCAAFAFSSMISSPPTMCKHLLAVRLADRLSKFGDRTRTEDDLLALAMGALQVFPNSTT